MPGTPGLRTRSGNRPGNTLYGSKRRVTVAPMTDEQRAKSDAFQDEVCAALTAGDAEAFFASVRKRNEELDEGDRALAREKDRSARKAVEGDTDLNHDNLEGGE